MTKIATVVIDSAFGDSGKGLMTDFFAFNAEMQAIVVRYNGGAQSGHTVVTPDGRRHVFHHFGAGTFSGAPTYLSEHFVVNPIMWMAEKQELIGVRSLYVDGKAPMTTPYDIMINRELERQRGPERHGSCGLGVNETLRREEAGFKVSASDTGNINGLIDKLRAIREIYLPYRLKQLNLHIDGDLHLLSYDSVIDSYVNACYEFRDNVLLCDVGVLRLWPIIIFEGAQGLLLDQDHDFFPHVTPSKTGLPNILSICRKVYINNIDVIYVMRPYMTRHGDGPFPTEDGSMAFEDITNETSEFQGKLRFGSLDVSLMRRAITKDLATAKGFSISPGIAVTHADQISNRVPVQFDGYSNMMSVADIVDEAKSWVDTDMSYVSYGPTRSDVSCTVKK